MELSRRVFIKNGALGLVSIGLSPVLGPSFVQCAAAQSNAADRRKTLVCLFMRGAADGLSIVVPHGEPELYRARPGIGIPRDQVVDLDGFFGLHPALSPIAPMFKQGHLAIVHACGSPSNSRSHFDAMDYMESGSPDDRTVHDGWLARAAKLTGSKQVDAPFRAIAIGSGMPRSLQGDQAALAIPDLKSFGIYETVAPNNNKVKSAAAPTQGLAGGFEALYDSAAIDALHGTGRESFEALRALKGINAKSYTPEHGAVYPQGKLGESFKQIAQLIKANVGVEIAFTEAGGWDTHANQSQPGSPSQGALATRLKDVAESLAAFYADLGDRMSDVVVLTMSEFGRTVKQNGTGGTDHGHASCFFALGGPIKGGKVYGDWPGLATEQLYESRDLAMTTDFRSVFGEVACKHLGVTNVANLFPNFTGGEVSFRGLI